MESAFQAVLDMPLFDLLKKLTAHITGNTCKVLQNAPTSAVRQEKSGAEKKMAPANNHIYTLKKDIHKRLLKQLHV